MPDPKSFKKTGPTLLPIWATIGPAADAITGNCRKRAKLVSSVLRVLHPGIAEWAKQKGLIPFLPRLFGGFGLPGKTLTAGDLPKWLRVCLRGVIYRSSHKEVMSFGQTWSCTKPLPYREMATQHTMARLSGPKVHYSRVDR